MSETVAFGAHQSNSESGRLLATFWPRIMSDIRNKPFLHSKPNGKKDEPVQELPLARIKKIMKQDGDVKMISAEAPILFSKAAEMFISELSLRAWIHTEDNKRRTLQRNDIAMAITKYDQFDFLIDIVPREELKPPKRQEEVVRHPPNVMAPEQVQYYFQLSQLQSNSTTTGGTQIAQLPPGAHVIQQNGQILIATPHQLGALTSTSTNGSPQIVQIGSQDTSTTADVQTHTEQTSQPSQAQTSSSQSSGHSTPSASSTQINNSQQVQYIRIPQSGLSNAPEVESAIQQFQQQQQNQTQTASSSSQVYQQIQGTIPSGATYVMAQAPSQQQPTTSNSR